MHEQQDSDTIVCERCGKCCLQGGPALHQQDRELVGSGRLTTGDLITVRVGELAYQPMADEPQPVGKEFLKLRGRPGSWSCGFFDAGQSSCTIYQDRPMACRLLDCREPEPLLAIIGKDLLTRFDLVDSNDPLWAEMKLHEQQCPCPDLASARQALASAESRDSELGRLEQAANLDIQFRTRAVNRYGLSVGQELFHFGRPLFQLLGPLGVSTENSGAGLVLLYRPSAS